MKTDAKRRNSEERNDPIIAANIRRYRTAAGLSQTDLGDALGVTFQQIQKYEKGKNAIAPGRLRQIAEICGISVGAMFGEPPKVDGETVPLDTERAHRVVLGLSKIKSERVKRALGDLIAELSEGK